ncbi:hypothetical protein [Streptosporangium sp. NPDC000396]|uniref:hypothetical protein n=1 Tax=Streptosporangium sp. NPDC000396 TaxID=3366185 RepID=UPI0036CB4432
MLTVVTLISCYWASGPVWSYDLVFLMFPIWLSLGLYWFFRMLAEARMTGWVTVRRQWFRWALTPLVFLGMVGALAVDGPRWVRFTLSEPSMQAYAKTIAAGGDIDESCRWLGLYYTCWGEPVEGGALIGIKDLGIHEGLGMVQTAGTGFAWLPGGRAPSDAGYDNEYTPFTGSWWDWQGWDSL